MNKKRIFHFLVLLFLAPIAFEINGQTVQGTTTDALTGKGIPNLTVAIGDCTAVTDSLGHYVIYLGEITSVEEPNKDTQNKQLPTTFELFQNYPNPFNAETIIRYQLPKASIVNLSIFNLLGQEIASLVDRKHEAGEYEIRWSGLDLKGNQVSSGIYIVNFVADTFVKSRKILLLK